MEPRATQGRPAPTRSLLCKVVSMNIIQELCNGTYGSGRRVRTAGDVLLALLVEQVLDGNSDEDGDCGNFSIGR